MQAPSAARRTYSIEEAARLLGIGTTKARAMAREGTLPGCFRIGARQYFVSRAVLDRVLETGELPAEAAGVSTGEEEN